MYRYIPESAQLFEKLVADTHIVPECGQYLLCEFCVLQSVFAFKTFFTLWYTSEISTSLFHSP